MNKILITQCREDAEEWGDFLDTINDAVFGEDGGGEVSWEDGLAVMTEEVNGGAEGVFNQGS